MSAALTSLLLILVPAPAADEQPFGAAPTLQFMEWKNGTIEQTVTVSKTVPIETTETVTMNGRAVVQKVVKLQRVLETHKQAIDPKEAEIYDLDGKKVDDAVWQKALAHGAIVLVAGDRELPHAAFRKAIKEGTLVVVLKPQPKIPAPK
jgi:hypothetical protein